VLAPNASAVAAIIVAVFVNMIFSSFFAAHCSTVEGAR
jgi:hypothetical protein